MGEITVNVTLENPNDRIGNRFMSTDCVVGPPLSEPLIGQIILEALDLIADCTNRTLTPRPESPDYPLLKTQMSGPDSSATRSWPLASLHEAPHSWPDSGNPSLASTKALLLCLSSHPVGSSSA